METPPEDKRNRGTAIVFAPFAGIPRHARLERRMELLLAQRFQRVVHMSCSGVLQNSCTNMISLGLKPNSGRLQRASVCRYCQSCATSLGKHETVVEVRLDDFVSADDFHWANDLSKSISPNNWRDFDYDGFPIARYCAYELILQTKTDDFSQNIDTREALKKLVCSGLVAYLVGKRIGIAEAPSLVALHSFQYGINRCFLAGVNVEDCEKISFTNAGPFSMWEKLVSISSTERLSPPAVGTPQHLYEDVPLDYEEFRAVETHLRDLMSAGSPWVYSVPKGSATSHDVALTLGLSANRKCVVVLTSSPDEPLAAETALLVGDNAQDYVTDSEFVQLVFEIAKENPSVDFVIRVHPRLLPNSRELRTSPWIDEFRKILESSPKNVIINWPSHGLSLYDIAPFAAAVLNHRSTAGLEFICLGIPVVVPFPVSCTSYPNDLNIIATSSDAEDVGRALQEIFDEPVDDRSTQAFRWLGYTMRRRLLDLGNVSGYADAPSYGNSVHIASALPFQIKDTLRPFVRAFKKLAVTETEWQLNSRESIDSLASTSEAMIQAISFGAAENLDVSDFRESDEEYLSDLRKLLAGPARH